MESITEKTLTKGGEFLIKESNPNDIFIPEQWNEDQNAVAGVFRDFIENFVLPEIDNLDSMKDLSLLPKLLTKAGEYGMLGASVPEEYGGSGLDFLTMMYSTEMIGTGFAFSVAISAHSGIGTLPILYFGNDTQKKKYLPKLASGEWKSCYCLTEPGSGSDALGAKTKAILSSDGKHYILNGQKMWITNAGFADIFIVFAKIDGDKFTGFIVEKGSEGLSLGEEEHKMGIKGSSTRQVFFTDVKVPVENVLGEIGKGHLIAFNVLNIGRIKLGASVIGGAKAACTMSIKYANERQQFNKYISSFGAIQHKLAEQAIRIYAAESALYRATEAIQFKEQELLANGKTLGEALMGGAQEYAAECAILKVSCSEVLDFVVDEGVQIFGGYGFSAEYPMDRPYRDSRINRIFEGTNEINRMLTVDYIMKKAMKGELNLMEPAFKIRNELMSIPDFGSSDSNELLEKERKAISNFKKCGLMVAGAAAQKYMMKLEEEQEILMGLADILIEIYIAESVYLRVKKLIGIRGEQACENQILMARTTVYNAAEKINSAARNIINAMSEGDEQRVMLLGVKRFTKVESFNTIAARRNIAAALIENNQYCF